MKRFQVISKSDDLHCVIDTLDIEMYGIHTRPQFSFKSRGNALLVADELDCIYDDNKDFNALRVFRVCYLDERRAAVRKVEIKSLYREYVKFSNKNVWLGHAVDEDLFSSMIALEHYVKQEGGETYVNV